MTTDTLMKETIKELLLRKSVLIMGVLNVTPDSFSDGGDYLDKTAAIRQAEKIVQCGADIIDIGGESTRPYADPVSAEEELRRVIPVIEGLKEIDVIVSVDTTKSAVAKAALEAGAGIVNDVSSFQIDKKMAKVVAEYQAQVVLMHMQGTPETMQDQPVYRDVVSDIFEYLNQRIQLALDSGIAKENIIVDPGIGFGKSTEDNLKIINQLARFKELQVPILMGVSRKSFIGNVLNINVPKERIFGTAAAVCLSIANGATIVRVHDVHEMRQVATMTKAILNA